MAGATGSGAASPVPAAAEGDPPSVVVQTAGVTAAPAHEVNETRASYSAPEVPREDEALAPVVVQWLQVNAYVGAAECLVQEVAARGPLWAARRRRTVAADAGPTASSSDAASAVAATGNHDGADGAAAAAQDLPAGGSDLPAPVLRWSPPAVAGTVAVEPTTGIWSTLTAAGEGDAIGAGSSHRSLDRDWGLAAAPAASTSAEASVAIVSSRSAHDASLAARAFASAFDGDHSEVVHAMRRGEAQWPVTSTLDAVASTAGSSDHGAAAAAAQLAGGDALDASGGRATTLITEPLLGAFDQGDCAALARMWYAHVGTYDPGPDEVCRALVGVGVAPPDMATSVAKAAGSTSGGTGAGGADVTEDASRRAKLELLLLCHVHCAVLPFRREAEPARDTAASKVKYSDVTCDTGKAEPRLEHQRKRDDSATHRLPPRPRAKARAPGVPVDRQRSAREPDVVYGHKHALSKQDIVLMTTAVADAFDWHGDSDDSNGGDSSLSHDEPGDEHVIGGAKRALLRSDAGDTTPQVEASLANATGGGTPEGESVPPSGFDTLSTPGGQDTDDWFVSSASERRSRGRVRGGVGRPSLASSRSTSSRSVRSTASLDSEASPRFRAHDSGGVLQLGTARASNSVEALFRWNSADDVAASSDGKHTTAQHEGGGSVIADSEPGSRDVVALQLLAGFLRGDGIELTSDPAFARFFALPALLIRLRAESARRSRKGRAGSASPTQHHCDATTRATGTSSRRLSAPATVSVPAGAVADPGTSLHHNVAEHDVGLAAFSDVFAVKYAVRTVGAAAQTGGSVPGSAPAASASFPWVDELRARIAALVSHDISDAHHRQTQTGTSVAASRSPPAPDADGNVSRLALVVAGYKDARALAQAAEERQWVSRPVAALRAHVERIEAQNADLRSLCRELYATSIRLTVVAQGRRGVVLNPEREPAAEADAVTVAGARRRLGQVAGSVRSLCMEPVARQFTAIDVDDADHGTRATVSRFAPPLFDPTHEIAPFSRLDGRKVLGDWRRSSDNVGGLDRTLTRGTSSNTATRAVSARATSWSDINPQPSERGHEAAARAERDNATIEVAKGHEAGSDGTALAPKGGPAVSGVVVRDHGSDDPAAPAKELAPAPRRLGRFARLRMRARTLFSRKSPVAPAVASVKGRDQLYRIDDSA